MFLGKERRLQQRVSVQLPVSAEANNKNKDKYLIDGTAVDISKAGMKIRTRKSNDIAVDRDVFVKLEMPDSSGYLKLKGRIKWIKEPEDSSADQEVGINLTGMNLPEWDQWIEKLQWSDE